VAFSCLAQAVRAGPWWTARLKADAASASCNAEMIHAVCGGQCAARPRTCGCRADELDRATRWRAEYAVESHSHKGGSDGVVSYLKLRDGERNGRQSPVGGGQCDSSTSVRPGPPLMHCSTESVSYSIRVNSLKRLSVQPMQRGTVTPPVTHSYHAARCRIQHLCGCNDNTTICRLSCMSCLCRREQHASVASIPLRRC
jgi:hypothetical protein